MAVMVLDCFIGTDNLEDWISGKAILHFSGLLRGTRFWNLKHFKEKLALRFQERTSPKSLVMHSQLTSILTLLQKIQDNLDKIHISTSSIPNHTGLSPTIIQEVPVEDDANSSATTMVSREVSSALGYGNSSVVINSEVHLEAIDTLIDTNLLVTGTDFIMGNANSSHADQVFDKSPHRITNSVH
ncbi:hypothetical protein P3S67_000469 [Capsicum chacoense]